MTLIAWLVYIPLQILWLPLSLPGVIWVAYKQIAVSSRMGVSQTAVEIINGRWTRPVHRHCRATDLRRFLFPSTTAEVLESAYRAAVRSAAASRIGEAAI